MTRLFSDSLGHTHFDNISVRLVDKDGSGAAGIGQLSQAIPSTGIQFRRTPGDYLFDWHCAPQEQFIVNLDADVEVTVTDGSSKFSKLAMYFTSKTPWALGIDPRL